MMQGIKTTMKIVLLIRYYEANTIQTVSTNLKLSSLFCTATNAGHVKEFRVLNAGPKPKDIKQKQTPIEQKMIIRADTIGFNEKWQKIWPTARTFHPDTVPLPLRQGYRHNKNPHPEKYGNAELMKIPNFLHLTPPAIEAHCKALRKFCTTWPDNLKDENEYKEHFPVEIITSNYCYSSPTIREPLTRIVSLRVKLSSLHLDAHAKDKMLRLVGDRYNHDTDILTLTADRCPTRKQNYEYVRYLLTALFHISRRVESWEAEKSEADMELYDWDNNKSKNNLISIHCWPNPSNDCNYNDIPHAVKYKTAVSDLINNGEDHSSIDRYKKAVKNILNLT